MGNRPSPFGMNVVRPDPQTDTVILNNPDTNTEIPNNSNTSTKPPSESISAQSVMTAEALQKFRKSQEEMNAKIIKSFECLNSALGFADTDPYLKTNDKQKYFMTCVLEYYTIFDIIVDISRKTVQKFVPLWESLHSTDEAIREAFILSYLHCKYTHKAIVLLNTWQGDLKPLLKDTSNRISANIDETYLKETRDYIRIHTEREFYYFTWIHDAEAAGIYIRPDSEALRGLETHRSLREHYERLYQTLNEQHGGFQFISNMKIGLENLVELGVIWENQMDFIYQLLAIQEEGSEEEAEDMVDYYEDCINDLLLIGETCKNYIQLAENPTIKNIFRPNFDVRRRELCIPSLPVNTFEEPFKTYMELEKKRFDRQTLFYHIYSNAERTPSYEQVYQTAVRIGPLPGIGIIEGLPFRDYFYQATYENQSKVRALEWPTLIKPKETAIMKEYADELQRLTNSSKSRSNMGTSGLIAAFSAMTFDKANDGKSEANKKEGNKKEDNKKEDTKEEAKVESKNASAKLLFSFGLPQLGEFSLLLHFIEHYSKDVKGMKWFLTRVKKMKPYMLQFLEEDLKLVAETSTALSNLFLASSEKNVSELNRSHLQELMEAHEQLFAKYFPQLQGFLSRLQYQITSGAFAALSISVKEDFEKAQSNLSEDLKKINAAVGNDESFDAFFAMMQKSISSFISTNYKNYTRKSSVQLAEACKKLLRTNIEAYTLTLNETEKKVVSHLPEEALSKFIDDFMKKVILEKANSFFANIKSVEAVLEAASKEASKLVTNSLLFAEFLRAFTQKLSEGSGVAHEKDEDYLEAVKNAKALASRLQSIVSNMGEEAKEDPKA